MKPRSRRLWRYVLSATGATALLSAAAGCVVERDDVATIPPQQSAGIAPQSPIAVAIDTDQVLTAAPGEGTGVFIQYATGGHWRVWTTCDTNTSGQPCSFDITASTPDGTAIANPQTEDLESGGWVSLGQNSVEVGMVTATAADALTFDTNAGASLELAVQLGGVGFDPHFYFWIGGGVLHQGAPTDPLDFIPSAP